MLCFFHHFRYFIFIFDNKRLKHTWQILRIVAEYTRSRYEHNILCFNDPKKLSEPQYVVKKQLRFLPKYAILFLGKSQTKEYSTAGTSRSAAHRAHTKPQQKPKSRVLPFDTPPVYHGSLLKARWDVAQKQHFLVVEFFCLFIIDARTSTNRRAN